MKEYKTKAENYPIDLRIADLKNLVQVQRDSATPDDDYMRGMYNGLLLAWSIVHEPYGADVEYMGSDKLVSKEKKFTRKKD